MKFLRALACGVNFMCVMYWAGIMWRNPSPPAMLAGMIVGGFCGMAVLTSLADFIIERIDSPS